MIIIGNRTIKQLQHVTQSNLPGQMQAPGNLLMYHRFK